MDMLSLRDRLAQMDSHFATTALKFYFTQVSISSPFTTPSFTEQFVGTSGNLGTS